MQKNEQAISPVIGVMLMLVVTIIIAALVSAFAGGSMSASSAKTPQAAIIASYSQSSGMTISHNGGDPIPLETTTLLVRPTKSFGSDAERYSWVVNKSYVYSNATQDWTTTRAFKAGDSATISAANLSYVQQRPDLTNDTYDSALGFANQNNLGLSFDLLFEDSSGKVITKSTVIISS